MRESWIKPFTYIDQWRQVTLVSVALVIVGLFLMVELVLWNNARLAVRQGQKVEVLVGYGKTYARLREDTRKVIEMTARAQEQLIHEERAVALSGISDKEQKEYSEKNAEIFAKIDNLITAAKERYNNFGLKWIARK